MADAVAIDPALTNPSQISVPAAPAPAPAADPQPAPAPQGDPAPAPNGQEPAVAAPAAVPSLDDPQQQPAPQALSEVVDGVVVYDQTGDVGLDMALAFVGKLGIAGDDPAMLQAAAGNFDFIKAKLASLGAPAQGWEQHVALAEKAHEEAVEAQNKQVAAIQSAVYDAVGGEENWKAVLEFARANADQSEKDAINAMFDAGPVSARAAAQMLLGLYQQASGTVVTPARATAPNAGGAAPDSLKPMTRAEYGAAARELYAKLGNRMEGSSEYADLRRRAGFR